MLAAIKIKILKQLEDGDLMMSNVAEDCRKKAYIDSDEIRHRESGHFEAVRFF